MVHVVFAGKSKARTQLFALIDFCLENNKNIPSAVMKFFFHSFSVAFITRNFDAGPNGMVAFQHKEHETPEGCL
jgi:hypothetical protein